MARGRGRSGGFNSGRSIDSTARWAAGERRRQAARDRASDRAERSRRGDYAPMSDNGTVSGEPAHVDHGKNDSPTRVDAYWPPDSPLHGHLVSRDGLNADYVRDPGMDHDDYVVDYRPNSDNDPYGPRG